jgi:hypothetical protein
MAAYLESFLLDNFMCWRNDASSILALKLMYLMHFVKFMQSIIGTMLMILTAWR